MARFFVGGSADGQPYFVSNDTFSWDVNIDSTWTRHQVALREENFIAWPNRTTTISFAEAITAAKTFGILFTDTLETIQNSDSLGVVSKFGAWLGIDNVGVYGNGESAIPEAPAAILAGIGFLLLYRKGRPGITSPAA